VAENEADNESHLTYFITSYSHAIECYRFQIHRE